MWLLVVAGLVAGAVGLFDDDGAGGGGPGGFDAAVAAGAPPPGPSPPSTTAAVSAVDAASQLAGGAPPDGAPGPPVGGGEEASAGSLFARLLAAPLVEPPVQVGWVSQRVVSSSADPVLPGGGVLDHGSDDDGDVVVSPVTPGSVEVALVEEGRAVDASAQVGAVAVAVDAPVGLAVSAAESPEVRVEVLYDGEATRAGFDKVAFSVEVTGLDVSRRFADVSADEASRLTREVSVTLSVDYGGFVDEFGADWAGRLRLVRFAPCALEPGALADCGGVAVVDGFVNDDDAGVVSVSLPVRSLIGGLQPGVSERSATGTVSGFALLAGGSSDTGDYGTTSLNAQGSWAVGTQSGDFTWTYGLPVPAPPAGAAPGVSFTYSSGAVDGLTADANTQGGVLGPGWSLSTDGFIERQYIPCAADGGAIADQCWVSDNATFSFAGLNAELIRTGTETPAANWEAAVYRLESHTGWVARKYRRTNATAVRGDVGVDNDGEYWVVTDPAGNRYWFGYGARRGDLAPATTLGSVQTVPVVGNHAGEPCNSLSNQWCHQAYRWSLDRIEDANGRLTNLFWSQEVNHYGIKGTPGWSEPYVAAALLLRIEYGLLVNAPDTTVATHQVEFVYHYRCTNPVSGACSAAPTAGTAANFPDVPVDQFCDTTTCANHAPTFYTVRMLRRVQTRLRDATGALTDAGRLLFVTEWVDGDGAGSDPQRLWLDLLQYGGVRGAAITYLPAVRFFETATALANRVDYNTAGGVSQMRYYRIGAITDEYGSELRVNYTKPKPCPAPWPATPPAGWGGFNNNTWSCFPRYWVPPSGPAGFGVWHKYVVGSVVQVDQSGAQVALSRLWVYQYPDVAGNEGGMAWHSDSNPLVPVAARSWGEYRGFQRVRVVEGHNAETNRAASEYVFHRGMHGDINTHSGSSPPPDVASTPSSLGSTPDLEQLRGLVREVVVSDFDNATNQPGSQVYSGTVTYYSSWATTSSWGTSWQVEPSSVLSRAAYAGVSLYGRVDYGYDSHSWMRRRVSTVDWGRTTSNYYNAAGDDGQVDDVCTTVEYTPATATTGRFLNGLVWRTAAFADAACTANPLADARVYYDGTDSTVTPASALAHTRYGADAGESDRAVAGRRRRRGRSGHRPLRGRGRHPYALGEQRVLGVAVVGSAVHEH